MRNFFYEWRNLAVLSSLLACACAGQRFAGLEKAHHIVQIENDQSVSDEKRPGLEFAWADRLTDRELSAETLAAYPLDSLPPLFEALDDVAFYSHGVDSYVDREAKVFEEIAKRKAQTKEHIERMFQRELSARHFERATNLKNRFPSVVLWDVPKILDEVGSSSATHVVYDISADAKTATLRPIPLESGAKIVVAAFGGCPVTARAMRYAETDSVMTEALRSRGLLVTIRFEPEGVALLNSKTPMRAYVARSQRDWPELDFSRSPTFYFMKDGKVLHQFVGWGPDADSAKDFREGLARIGATP